MNESAEIKRARVLSTEAPWRWLSSGWADFKRDPILSLGYGLVFVLAGVGVSYWLWSLGLSATIPVAIGCFALIGPLMAAGLYELSRRHESGETYSYLNIIFVRAKSPMQIAYMGFLIMFFMLVWGRIAIILYALFVSSTYMPLSDFTTFILETPQGLSMLIVGTIIGAGIALMIFAMSVFSIPMLMDRRTDLMTAVFRSLQSIHINPGVMLQWAWLIVMLVGAGILTGFLGLLVVFPVLGHASWHAYKDVFYYEG